MKKQLFKAAITHGPRLFPQVMIFLKKWWWALLLGGLVLGGLGVWLAISIALWLWHALPDVLGYVINHFAPAFEGGLAPEPAPTPAPLETL